MEYVELTKSIMELGFPVVVSTFLLVKLDKSMKNIEIAIVNLTNELKNSRSRNKG
ncbi:YvrJ family protein [Lysinibacillus fusiformis]|uniref:YvrJ family protein n=1 Tax=Lysinibacillus fusiformis TaxID=28031 RepID=UPI003D01BB6C